MGKGIQEGKGNGKGNGKGTAFRKGVNRTKKDSKKSIYQHTLGGWGWLEITTLVFGDRDVRVVRKKVCMHFLHYPTPSPREKKHNGNKSYQPL